MFDIFNKPHPFIFNRYSIIIPSAVAFLIIVLLAPFGFQVLELPKRIIYASLISAWVALGIWATMSLLMRFLPNIMAEDRWTLGKELVLILFVMLIIILLILSAFILFQKDERPIAQESLKIASISLTISLLPIFTSILFEQYRHQKSQLKKALMLTKYLKTRNEELSKGKIAGERKTESLLIKSDNDTVELQLEPQELIYIKSDGNYLEVYFHHIHKIQKKLIRNRLKAIENVLPEEIFFRCHNSFIINGNHIISVEGNARNLSLYLKDISMPIPVSRAKAKAISTFLQNLQA